MYRKEQRRNTDKTWDSVIIWFNLSRHVSWQSTISDLSYAEASTSSSMSQSHVIAATVLSIQLACVTIGDSIRPADRVPESNAHDTMAGVGRQPGTRAGTGTCPGVTYCDTGIVAFSDSQFTVVAVGFPITSTYWTILISTKQRAWCSWANRSPKTGWKTNNLHVSIQWKLSTTTLEWCQLNRKASYFNLYRFGTIQVHNIFQVRKGQELPFIFKN